jgi:hypothetical protein
MRFRSYKTLDERNSHCKEGGDEGDGRQGERRTVSLISLVFGCVTAYWALCLEKHAVRMTKTENKECDNIQRKAREHSTQYCI